MYASMLDNGIFDYVYHLTRQKNTLLIYNVIGSIKLLGQMHLFKYVMHNIWVIIVQNWAHQVLPTIDGIQLRAKLFLVFQATNIKFYL